MRILIVSATTYEMTPLIAHLDKHAKKTSFFEYSFHGNQVIPLVTGVGSTMTAFALARFPDMQNVDLAINLGIAGCFDIQKYPLGSVVSVVKDRFADLGVEHADGSFEDVYQMELSDGNQYPYQEGWISNSKAIKPSIPMVSGVTVNTVTGSEASIGMITSHYKADVETMESAAFLYATAVMDVAALSVRGISNAIEPRNRDNWHLAEAIESSNNRVIGYLETIDVLM